MRACTASRIFAAPYPLSKLLIVRTPSGPRDASQTLYAMAAQAKRRSRCFHQPAAPGSEDALRQQVLAESRRAAASAPLSEEAELQRALAMSAQSYNQEQRQRKAYERSAAPAGAVRAPRHAPPLPLLTPFSPVDVARVSEQISALSPGDDDHYVSVQRLREQLLQTPVPNLPAVLDHLEAENAIMVAGDAIYPI